MAAGSAAETVIGAIVLVAAAGFIAFAAETADLSAGGDRYELEAKFRKADGLSVGTDVRVSGVKVGTVEALELDPTTYLAVARLSLDSEIELPEDSDARIESDGLLGGNYVAITPGASDFMLISGDEIINTQGSVSLIDLILKFGSSVGGE
ncbi:phospholipid/cholesterol/gamma-HCH transport system substrate-binding protein [Rubricella aquisinus]|uniref:Phospholipid/cholesterol/gamma-HCH transport system substrate-binding protein n=1 Tax=Rubricella aquisinus TaxID=2028108 RepID=A0A840WWQ8_9RHOB|nr:outer membrane lipid asymmetry maintenance protein MlaD [Rubricella aquisinus]MBB5514754.1 phospholipid/cholesterol/gamma-HCH transport system substrate-binding protein [Rubricella aquisinus]